MREEDIAIIKQYMPPVVNTVATEMCVEFRVDTRVDANVVRAFHEWAVGESFTTIRTLWANETFLMFRWQGKRVFVHSDQKRSPLILFAHKKFTIVADDITADIRSHLLRVVSELYLRCLAELGGTKIHGGAYVHKDGAVVVIGPHAAGKTTLIFAMAQRSGNGFLANDNIVLLHGSHGIVAYPVPMRCRIGVATARRLERFGPVLNNHLPLYLEQHEDLNKSAAASQPDSTLLFGSKVKLALTAREIQQLLGLPHYGPAAVSRVLIPKLHLACSEPRLERLTVDDAIRCLQDNVIELPANFRHSHYIRRDIHAEEQDVSLIRRVGANVPVYRLEFGAEYAVNGVVAPSLLKAVGE